MFLVAHSFGTCLAVRLAAALGSALAGLVLIGAFHPGLGGGAMRSLFLLPEAVRGMPASLYELIKLQLNSDWLDRSLALHPVHRMHAFACGLFIEPKGCGCRGGELELLTLCKHC